MEIEQRVSSFPVCGLKEQEQHEAESLNTKLQLLKNRLVTVQLQLQERHCEDQVHTHTLIHPELSLLPTCFLCRGQHFPGVRNEQIACDDKK